MSTFDSRDSISKPRSQITSVRSLTHMESELDALSELLQPLLQAASLPSDAGARVSSCLELFRQAANEAAEELRIVQKKSDDLARAQADALVYSAEIIDELDETRQRLAEARAIAEEAARDTQRLADTVFECTHDAVLIMKESYCVACNDNACSLVGDREEIIGKWPPRFSQAILETGEAANADLIECYNAAMQGNVRTVEVGFTSASGNDVWCEVTMTAFHMQSGDHVLVTVHDITNRKQFERELRRHRDFLDNIINAVPDHLVVGKSDNALVVANDAFCESFGYQRDQVIGLSIDEVNRVFAQDSSETEVTLVSGTQKVFSTKCSRFQDSVSGDTYTVATSRDITEERARERRLSLLASVFRSAAEGVAILTRDGRVLEANPTFLQMVGMSLEEILHKSLASVMRIRVSTFANDLAQVAEGQNWSGKLQVDSGQNPERWYWATISRSCDAGENGGRLIALFSDVTALEVSQRQLEKQALYDNLTGLPNRRFFKRHIASLINDSEEQQCIAVCFLDLDDFKHVNDTQGHSAGDKLLKQVARRLTKTVGNEAFVARFGGDEFAIILTNIDPACRRVATLTDQVLTALKQPFQPAGNDCVIGVSIGVTLYPEHATDVELLMKNADIAMYAAKAAGKNSVRIFNTGMQETVDLRHRIHSELRNALRGGHITLHFQPKLCSQTGRLAGCEALSRWQRPDGTYISPSEFIPIAEQTGLINSLGELVLTTAARTCRRWADEGFNPFPIAVNISPQQLRHPAFLDRIQCILAETGARPEWIELEITENAVVDDLDRARRTILNLSKIGIRTAIDDFGKGYSSLSYLATLPIQTLKIDSSFVRQMVEMQNTAAIVRSIVGLGKGLNLTVVGEGVETEEQADLLKSMGCDVLQGYLVSRPISEKNFRAWMQARGQIDHSLPISESDAGPVRR
ncbi:MAG: EAL domain-containing protein [Planctomycetaceae bacterium]